jgi:hypothetical protein
MKKLKVGSTRVGWPLALVFTCALLPLDGEAAKFKVDTSAEPTFDGLYPVTKGKRASRLWVKPDLDLSGYTKILPHGEGVSFRDVPKSPARSANEFPIDEANQEALPELAREIFRKELSKSERYTLTDQPGPDVLMIRGALIDVVSHVPPDTVGRRRVYLRSVGAATLVLELRDSETGEVLARAADRREGDRGGTGMQIDQRAEVRSEVTRVLREWARRLRQRLDEITTL